MKQILHFLYLDYEDEGLFKNCRNILIFQWRAPWRERLNQVDKDSQITAENDALVLTVKKSVIPRPKLGLTCLHREILELVNVEQYCARLVYRNLASEKQKWRVYE